jgi:hypothetical protein
VPEPLLVGRGRRAQEGTTEKEEEDMSERKIEIKIITGTSARTIEWPEKSGPDYSELDELRRYSAEHWWDAPEGSEEEELIGAIEMLAVQIKEQADCHARLVAAAREALEFLDELLTEREGLVARAAVIGAALRAALAPEGSA